jgi:hypothetical protein
MIRPEREKATQPFLQGAQTAFDVCRDKHWRCESRNAFGTRCVNHKDGHDKGHQFDNANGSIQPSRMNIFRPGSQEANPRNGGAPALILGPFQCSVKRDKFLNSLFHETTKYFQYDVTYQKRFLAKAALDTGVVDLSSNKTCVVCFNNCPAHVLPCRRPSYLVSSQHTICDDCAETFSIPETSSSAMLHLQRCPLGCSLLTKPWPIRRKPLQAGVRILSLDG